MIYQDAETLARIDLFTQWAPPPIVFEIPGDGFLDPGFECLLRAPAELSFELGRIHGVTEIMARPIRHEGDEVGIARVMWSMEIESRTDGFHDLQIGAFGGAP